MDDLVIMYFHDGLSYRELVAVLHLKHNIYVSLRHLKRILKKLNLQRRTIFANDEYVIDFIENQLLESGQLHGYRWMHEKCLEHGVKVRREDVRIILKALDSNGVARRKARRLQRRSYFARGPNFLWHVDSYDKLKPFGFCINGCIDGFSIKIIGCMCQPTLMIQE